MPQANMIAQIASLPGEPSAAPAGLQPGTQGPSFAALLANPVSANILLQLQQQAGGNLAPPAADASSPTGDPSALVLAALQLNQTVPAPGSLPGPSVSQTDASALTLAGAATTLATPGSALLTGGGVGINSGENSSANPTTATNLLNQALNGNTQTPAGTTIETPTITGQQPVTPPTFGYVPGAPLETASASTGAAQILAPQTHVPPPAEPQTHVPQTQMPQSQVPQTHVSQTLMPPTAEPQTLEPPMPTPQTLDGADNAATGPKNTAPASDALKATVTKTPNDKGRPAEIAIQPGAAGTAAANPQTITVQPGNGPDTVTLAHAAVPDAQQLSASPAHQIRQPSRPDPKPAQNQNQAPCRRHPTPNPAQHQAPPMPRPTQP